jgi:hypothetical protein
VVPAVLLDVVPYLLVLVELGVIWELVSESFLSVLPKSLPELLPVSDEYLLVPIELVVLVPYLLLNLGELYELYLLIGLAASVVLFCSVVSVVCTVCGFLVEDGDAVEVLEGGDGAFSLPTRLKADPVPNLE